MTASDVRRAINIRDGGEGGAIQGHHASAHARGGAQSNKIAAVHSAGSGMLMP